MDFLTEVVSGGPSQPSAFHLLLFPGCPYFRLNRIYGSKEFTQCDGVSNISVLIWKNAVKSQAKGAMGKVRQGGNGGTWSVLDTINSAYSRPEMDPKCGRRGL